MAHRVSPEATLELYDIWLYVARDSGSIDIADRLIDSITSHFHLLASFPELGRRRDRDLKPGIRSLAVGEYLILYTLHGPDIVIDHIVRGSRNLRMLLRD